MNIPDEHDLVIRTMVDQGYNNRQIAEEYHTSRQTVGTFRRKHGIESKAKIDRSRIKRNKKTRAIPAADKEKVRAMVQSGMSDPKIAKGYKCSSEAVGLYRKRHGIPLRLILTLPPEVKGTEVRFERPKEVEGYYDETVKHWVRVFERMPAIGDLKPENENDDKRDTERAANPGDGETRTGGQRPNHNPGWTNG